MGVGAHDLSNASARRVATYLLHRYVAEVLMFEQVARNEEREHRQSIVYLVGVAIAVVVLLAMVLLR
jgi:uncharacterized membrane protein